MRKIILMMPVSVDGFIEGPERGYGCFRRSGLPVPVMRSKRGWMLSYASVAGWLVPLLSLLLSPSALKARVQHARSCVSRACVDHFGSFFRLRVFRPESS